MLPLDVMIQIYNHKSFAKNDLGSLPLIITEILYKKLNIQSDV